MSSYTRTTWVNDDYPAINAENLNNLEEGMVQVFSDVSSLQDYELSSAEYADVCSRLNIV